jgi:hypothetical protein
VALLISRLHNTPWVNGIEIDVEQHARAQGCQAEQAVLEQRRRQPAGIDERRHQQRVGPHAEARQQIPAMAPAAVPLRHSRPPKNAGANWTTAANDNSPDWASAAEAPIIQ